MAWLADIDLPHWLIRWSAHPTFDAVSIVVGSALLALLVDMIARRLLRKIAAKTATKDDDKLVEILHTPIPITIFAVGLWTGVSQIELPDPIPFILRGIFLSIALLYWARVILRVSDLVLDIAGRLGRRRGLVQKRTIPFFDLAGKLIVYALTSYGILLAWGIDVTAWVASAGIIGIAVGFAAQDTLSHVFAGLYILADGPYQIGDWLILDSGERGEVTELGLRSTRIRTQDDVEIIIPNAMIANGRIINASGGPYEMERVHCPIGVAYGSDIEAVKALLFEVARTANGVVAEPEPQVLFLAFGDSSLDLEVMAWIEHPRMRPYVIDAINSGIYLALNEAGVEIPFPKRDVYLKRD